MKVINLIAGPRNLSTPLLYAFAQRDGIEVFDEPFYGYYLKHAALNIPHPAREQILAGMESDPKRIVQQITDAAQNSEVFLKNMAHHFLMSNPDFLLTWTNVLLIRRPERLIASFAKIIPYPKLQDIGLKKSVELFKFLKEKRALPLVIDSDELLKNPKQYLSVLCKRLEIPFSKKMLSWNKGGIPQDGIWAKHWYKNLHKSRGFAPQKTSSRSFPNYLRPVLEEALPYYEVLQKEVLLNPAPS